VYAYSIERQRQKPFYLPPCNFQADKSSIWGFPYCKPPGGNHRLAAASAAITDKIDPLPDIFPGLDQVVFICELKKIEPFRSIYRPSVFVSDQRSGRCIKGHADVKMIHRHSNTEKLEYDLP